MEKTKYNYNFEETSQIEGFDIELNEESARRIDRLVDNYEKSIVNHLDEEYIRKTSLSDRIADKMASFGGSWTFIIIFALFLAIWIIWNTLSFTVFHFDPSPFILLNLCLSFIAAFQAPIIMMSQNRQASRDKNESIIDFAINYKSEQEIDDIQNHLHRLHQEVKEIKALLLAIKEEERK
jgi:uncharacterized membrane protein